MSAEPSPRARARIAGAFYALTFVAGSLALVGRKPYDDIANLIAAAPYVGVTLLFYGIFKPVNKHLSLLAASLGLLGCAYGLVRQFHLDPLHIDNLVFFGCYTSSSARRSCLACWEC